MLKKIKNILCKIGYHDVVTIEKLNDNCFMMYHFRGKGVSNDELAWKDFETMDKGESKKFTRPFQMKKINMKKNGSTQDYDHFSHKHVFREETEKEINKTIWNGRLFIDDNNSVPHGFDISTLK